MTDYKWTTLVLILALLSYVHATLKVGGARGKFGIKAPATTGNEDFERVFRAHQNSVEQMVLFVPLLALAACTWGDMWAGIYGLTYSVGRVLYTEGYAKAAEKRSFGFMLSGGASLAVLIGIIVTMLLRHFGVGA